MLLQRRKHGSQRAMKPLKIELVRSADQRDDTLTFLGEDGVYYQIAPEGNEELRLLLSEIHVLFHQRSP